MKKSFHPHSRSGDHAHPLSLLRPRRALTYMGKITSDLAVFDTLPDDVEMRVELR
jgi:hypothetical protein